MNHPFLVVGAGFAGGVVARELAKTGRRLLLIDKREHVAGNAYDEHNSHEALAEKETNVTFVGRLAQYATTTWTR